MELAFSNEEFNLRKREADVAIRFTPNPPQYLIGRRILNPAGGIYGSREYLQSHDPEQHPEKLCWIGWDDHSAQTQRYKDSRFSSAPVVHTADDISVQLEAVKLGMGIAVLPCFLADRDTSLQRLELLAPATNCGELWILTHQDLRATARVRAFIDYMLEVFERHRDLMEGRCYSQKPSLVTAYA